MVIAMKVIAVALFLSYAAVHHVQGFEDLSSCEAEVGRLQKAAVQTRDLELQLENLDAQYRACTESNDNMSISAAIADRLREDLKRQRDIATNEGMAAKAAKARLKDREKELEAVRKQLMDQEAEAGSVQEQLQQVQSKLRDLGTDAEASSHMKAELAALQAKLADVQQHWLPLWAHPYYESTVKPAMNYYKEEIATGRALERSRTLSGRVYERSSRALGPALTQIHTSAMKFLHPVVQAVHAQGARASAAVREELRKDKYRPLVQRAEVAQGYLNRVSAAARGKALVAWRSEGVQRLRRQAQKVISREAVGSAVAFARAQLARTEADLQRILTSQLKSKTPGSGLDDETIVALVRLLMYGFPLALVLYFSLGWCCKRRVPTVSAHAQATSSQTSRRSGKSSKSRSTRR